MADSRQLTDEVREPNALARSGDFLTAVRAEMRKVTWPTRDELSKATRMIVTLALLLGITIGLLDWMLQKILVDGVARLAR
ncbi:MAG: preprotein translocase subunit SecE [Gemmatimonadales bacterium]|nr:preprotein translocase subunit SecE [Gemmatimonadales bacterium]